MGAGQSAVSLITSRLRRSEGFGAGWTAHDGATWWVPIAWLLLRVVYLVNGYISQALANREREDSPTLLPISRVNWCSRPRRRTPGPMPRWPPRRHPAHERGVGYRGAHSLSLI